MILNPNVMVIVLYTPIVCSARPNVKHSTPKNLLRPNGLAYLLFASLTKKGKKSFLKMNTKVSSLTHLDILPSRKWAKPHLHWRRIVSKNAAASTMVVLTLAPWVMCIHIRVSLNAQGAKANITNGCSLPLSLAVFAMKIRSCECILKGFLGKS